MPPRGKLLGPELEAEIRKLVREEHSRIRNPNPGHRRTWWRRGEETSGGVLVIRFQIWQADCEGCTAIAEVISRPPAISAVPGEFVIQENQFGTHPAQTYSDGTQKKFVDIYDVRGSFLNETDRDLAGRRGHAVYLKRETRVDDLCEYIPDTRWEIFGLDEQQDVC